MGKQPRHHHYVPQFYLAGFTATGMVDGPLHVLDRQEGRTWKSTPKGTAHERDFHAVDMGSENDRMVIERKLAECEGKWALVLKAALQEHVLPKDESIGDLLAFVSFMAVRVPRIRSQASDFVDRASKSQLRATFATNVGRDHFRSVIEEQITSLPLTEQRNIRQLLDDDPNLDKFAEFVQNEEYTVSYGQTWDVQTMLKMAITLLPILGQRNWAVSLLADDAPDLVCSDSPVCLTWNQPNPGPHSPGFGLRDTLITIPLGKRLALFSTFDHLPETRHLSEEDVATLNTRTILHANQIYLPRNDFVWITDSGRIGGAKDFLDVRPSR